MWIPVSLSLSLLPSPLLVRDFDNGIVYLATLVLSSRFEVPSVKSLEV